MTHKLDFIALRNDFPILEREVRVGIPLIYLDSAATSQKPRQVIQAMQDYYCVMNANIHRGVHTLAEEATGAYESARMKIQNFIGAAGAEQVIYTRNTTEAINLVAYAWGRTFLKPGDLIILTEMEHHSNLVPWHLLASEKSLRLEFIPVTDEGILDLVEYQKLLRQEPKLVSFVHMSNVLGTINPAKQIIQMAHEVGAVTLLDGAQSVPHFPINVQDLDVDFLAASAHKMCGPTGIGFLYGKKKLLEAMPPFMGGGDMIKKVNLRSFAPNDLPYKFEAGTPAIAEAIGFGAAVDFLNAVGMDHIFSHEQENTAYALERLQSVPGVTLLGPSAQSKGGVAAFTLDHIHPHDVAQILDQDGVAVRAGHHCAMPLHQKYNIPASTRASFYLYTTKAEIDVFINSLYKVKKLFG